MPRRLILYIATNLDGYIATRDEDLSFLDRVAREGEDHGYAEFTAGVDTVLMGRRTYEKVAAMGVPDPHPGRRLYVITSSPRPAQGDIHFYSGDPIELVRRLKGSSGRDIYCDGGAELANALIAADLVDRYVISTIPVLLGDGIRLFRDGRPQQALKLLDSRAYPSGLVQNWYERVR